jgi:hypothetical protein
MTIANVHTKKQENKNVPSFLELDSHADTSCIGANCRIIAATVRWTQREQGICSCKFSIIEWIKQQVLQMINGCKEKQINPSAILLKVDNSKSDGEMVQHHGSTSKI